jgi:hypothetical protein
MTRAETIIALVGVALLLATFVGLGVRGRWRLWYAFAAYLIVVAGFGLVFVSYPSLYRPGVYLVQALLVNSLRFAMAIELAARTFGAFPGARSTLRWTLLGLLILTLALVMAVPGSSFVYESFLNEVQPRLLNGSIWIFTAIAALILWYRLPVAPLHKSILLSYVPFLLYDSVFLTMLLPVAWQHGALPAAVAYFNLAVYLLLVSYWAWVAWRPPEPPRPDPPPPRPSRVPDDTLMEAGSPWP